MSIKGTPSSQENQSPNESQPNKPAIERGASWSFTETRILLSLWGQDMVQRQLTNSKRTRHVWEKIAERIRENGYERTADQVRTRVFNMIAEYRRILKNPTPEKKKKCVFFDALHKIYQAKDTNGVKAALNNYEEEYTFDPADSNMADETNDGADNGDEDNSDDNEENFAYSMSPPQALTNGGSNIDHDDSCDGMMNNDDLNIGRNPAKRFRSESNTSYHQYPPNGYLPSSYESSSSVLLIDRMFSHLTKEMEVMRECIKLEKERLSREASRRKEESEREERREKAFLQTMMKMQEQTFNFLASFTTANDHENPRLQYQSYPNDQAPNTVQPIPSFNPSDSFGQPANNNDSQHHVASSEYFLSSTSNCNPSLV